MRHQRRCRTRMPAVLILLGFVLPGCSDDSSVETTGVLAGAPWTTVAAAPTTTAAIEPGVVVELVEGAIVWSGIGPEGVMRFDFMADEDCIDTFGEQQSDCVPGQRLLRVTAHPVPGVFHLLATDAGGAVGPLEVNEAEFAAYLAGTAASAGDYAIARDSEVNRFLIEFDPSSPGLDTGGVGELLALRIVQVR